MNQSPFSQDPDERLHVATAWLSRQGLASLGYAYRDAADVLCSAPGESGRSDEAMYLVASFCYRHSLELYLKSVVELIEVHTGRDAPNHFRGRHKLLTMWDWISDRLRQLGLPALPPAERAVVESFEQVDPNGTAFRYNLDLQGYRQLTGLPPAVSLNNLQRAATRTIDLLEGLEESLSEAPE